MADSQKENTRKTDSPSYGCKFTMFSWGGSFTLCKPYDVFSYFEFQISIIFSFISSKGFRCFSSLVLSDIERDRSLS